MSTMDNKISLYESEEKENISLDNKMELKTNLVKSEQEGETLNNLSRGPTRGTQDSLSFEGESNNSSANKGSHFDTETQISFFDDDEDGDISLNTLEMRTPLKSGQKVAEKPKENLSFEGECSNSSTNSGDLFKKELALEDEILNSPLPAEKVIENELDQDQYFNNLVKLLSKSQFYSNFISVKLKEQEKKDKLRLSKLNKPKAINKKESPQEISLMPTRSSQKENQSENIKQGVKRKQSPSTDAAPKKKKLNQNNKYVSYTMTSEELTATNIEDEDSIQQPELITGAVMRPYQLKGFHWLKLLHENGINGILADEMGLGKTIQCISLIAHLIKIGIPGPYLIIAPLSTLPNWANEFATFAPKIPFTIYHGDKDKRIDLRRTLFAKKKVDGYPTYPVIITTYSLIYLDLAFLNKKTWRYIIIDEGHRIKNHECQLVRCLKSLGSCHRLLLTGTPLHNNLTELWSLLNFLLPEIFDNLKVFESWFDVKTFSEKETNKKIIAQEQEKHVISTVHKILEPFLLRRTKADVELNLPPKQELLVYAPLTLVQEELYKGLVNKTIFEHFELKNKNKEEVALNEKGRPLRNSTKDKINYKEAIESANFELKPVEIKKKQIIIKETSTNVSLRNIMMQLRKVCNHPYLIEQPINEKREVVYNPDFIQLSGKLTLLHSMLIELKKRNHKVLIFCQMVRMLDILEEYCIIKDHSFCRLDGSTSLEDRQEAIQSFNTDESLFLFLISTRAGGLGINLTGADTVILFDSDWNPQVDLQAQDRCHRLGQTKPVLIYRLVTANTIDEKIVVRASNKRKLEKMIMKKGRFASGYSDSTNTHITPEELLELLQAKDGIEIRETEKSFTKDQIDMLMDRKLLFDPNISTKEIKGLFKIVSSEKEQ